jgi:predicted permease
MAFAARFALERLREVGVAAPLERFSGSFMDLRLGLRMLVKYPGLTAVASVAIALGVAVTVGVGVILRSDLDPRLPLPDPDRVVTVENVDLRSLAADLRALHDFVVWRESLRSLETLGAFATRLRNLESEDGWADPVSTAEITAAALRLAGESPVLGRLLDEADERPGAPRVVVIGHRVWQARFAGSPGVVGHVVRVGGEPATVVGVMPEDFRYPVSHDMWEPFRHQPSSYEPGNGPAIRTIGRLAPGASLETAQAELAALRLRAASPPSDRRGRLRPRVVPYLHAFSSPGDEWERRVAQAILGIVLLIVCANVGLLVLARTLARSGEIAVRNALGASRARIVGQIFLETLVLSALAAGLGLAVAQGGLALVQRSWEAYGEALPFWASLEVAPSDWVLAAGLAVLSAVVAGVGPGLRATGPHMTALLRQSWVGVPGVRFGLGSSVLIVSQVVLSVCLFLVGSRVAESVLRFIPDAAGIPLAEYAVVELRWEPETSAAGDDRNPDRFSAMLADLERRLEAEPGVAHVTFGSRMPFMNHNARFIQVEGIEPPAGVHQEHGASLVRGSSVGPDYFEAFDGPVTAGRGFREAGVEDPDAVIVSQALVATFLGGRNAVGRRLRYVSRRGGEPGPWYTIVGVAGNVWGSPDPTIEGPVAAVYHPLAGRQAREIHLAVRSLRAPTSVLASVRAAAADVDPSLLVTARGSLEDVFRAAKGWFGMTVLVLAVGTGAALLLGLAGIYAMVSFTVEQRTREIGIRGALGASRWSLGSLLVARAMRQVALGAAIGALLVAALFSRIEEPGIAKHLAVVVPLVILFGFAAALVPTRRGLRTRPADALRAEG